jgi:hypothetical protein
MSSYQLELWSDESAAPSCQVKLVTALHPGSTAEHHASTAVRWMGLADVDADGDEHALDARAQFYAQNALAERTRAAYRGDVAAFVRWCASQDKDSFPTSSRTLAKTWLFCGHDVSARRAADALTIITTCKKLGIEPRSYIRDTLRRILEGEKDLTLLLPEN